MPRGRPRKPDHLHLLQGTWRRDRHGPKPDTASAKDEATAAAWARLRLPGITPAAPRALDPIEELLQREKIEILPEDRKPKR
jgi:hypothetical protein